MGSEPQQTAEMIDLILKSGVAGVLVLVVIGFIKGTFVSKKHHDEVVGLYAERLKEASEREAFLREAWTATNSQADRSVSIAEKVIRR